GDQTGPRTVTLEIQVKRNGPPGEDYSGSLQDLIAIRYVRIEIDEVPFAEYSIEDTAEGEDQPKYDLLLRHSATHDIWNQTAATDRPSEGNPLDTRLNDDREDVRQWLAEIDSGEALDSADPDAEDTVPGQSVFVITDLFGIPQVKEVPDMAMPQVPGDWEQETIPLQTFAEMAATELAHIPNVNLDHIHKSKIVALYRRQHALRPQETHTDILQAVVVATDASLPSLKHDISMLRARLKDRFQQGIAFPDALPDEEVENINASTELLVLLRELPHHRFSYLKSPHLRIASQVVEFLRKDLQEYKYIGPKRATVPRDLTDRADAELSTWGNGLGAWRYLLHCDNDQIERINTWLGKQWMETGYQINREQIVELVLSDHVLDEIIEHYAKDADDDDSLFQVNSPLQDADEANRQRLKEALTKLKRSEHLRLSIIPYQHRTGTLRSANKTISLHLQEHSAPRETQDLGEGFTQVLPVLVTLATLRKHRANGLAAIEQPELHLHPSLAARLADVLMNAMFASRAPTDETTDSPQPLTGNVFVETHSELLPLRILRRIRETTAGTLPPGRAPVRPADFAVYWVDQQRFQTSFQRLEISDDGQWLTRWPRGFFSEQAEELF
ncbi:MAG: AAA family ATPase, partial [Planctomycetaceae bacterium]